MKFYNKKRAANWNWNIKLKKEDPFGGPFIGKHVIKKHIEGEVIKL